MTSAILSAISVLTKPVAESSLRDAPSSQQEALLGALQANRALLWEQLETESSFEGVRRLREEVRAGSDWFSSDTEDVPWGFVQECLLLLLTLGRHLSAELERFRETPPPSAAKLRTPEMAPALPPDVLSVTQQKTLGAALQFVVSLGLCPYLAPGVGVPLGRRSAFGAMVEKVFHAVPVPATGRRLLTTVKVLLQLAELSCLATLVFTRHLGDVMAALCQLGYQPRREEKMQDLSPEECKTCKEALKKLLRKVYQPIVITELLILQGGPKQSAAVGSCRGSASRSALRSAPAWLRCLCGRLLSERLMQPKGVQAVVRAILEGGMGGESDWRKCEAVAWILVTPPQQCASADSYFTHVCPQILDLLHFKDQLTAQQFQRVATRRSPARPSSTCSLLCSHTPHRCTPASNEGQSQAAVEDDVYKIWVVGNSPSASLLTALEEVLPVVFTLFCFTKQNVSHLRAPCQEILLRYLSTAEASAALSALRQLSGLQGQRSGGAADLLFTPGSDGGARLSCRERCSEEDDALYEKLSGEQWRLEVLMQLLNELKDSDLPGDFFLELLQGLASCGAAGAGGRCEAGPQTGSAAGAGYDGGVCAAHSAAEETFTGGGLHGVPAAEGLCWSGSEHRSRLGEPSRERYAEYGVGLLATLLSGPQLSVEDYSSMWRLLPPLETLSEKHSDVFIQELASNLRAVIATHGAYRPEHFSSEAQRSRNPETIQPACSEPGSGTSPRGGWRTSGTSKPGPPIKPFSDLLLEACDPDVPTRAFALRVLTLMVQKKNPEAAQEQEKVLMLFLENLEHEDSFVYLSAIQGLAALADSYPERILERLLKDFQHGPSLPTSITEHSLETRLKVGEVLMRASRAMGELAPHFGRPLVGVFLQGTRDPDPGVRASSLSNLGELCPRLDSTLPALAQETEKEAEVRRASVHVITLLLRGLSDKTTQSPSLPVAAGPRSGPVITEQQQLLRANDTHSDMRTDERARAAPCERRGGQVLSDVLLDLYRALKWVVRSDPDDVAVLHAQLALEELDDVMRRFIFPEQKLEKKIVFLP
ncbi:Transport and Golgi organization protein 6 like [Dissostichus eleginoides]|uniref:Transport and Golgi organization protein 6 like n=1 Tax=Dissostichus eleginoides TaxID=100907 RepID=A0AAD9BRF4_DISEL|nr:Transport and Golgi organization protein 6 like [Dissostichus eleginoides]